MYGATLGAAALPIVLVASAQHPPAVVTRLCALAYRGDDGDATPLQIEGGDWLDAETAERWAGALIPHVRRGLAALGIAGAQNTCWRVSLRVPDAVALSGRPCRLEGSSADAACLCVLIASALGIRTRKDTLLTGAVRIDAQRLGLVGMLPEKLLAAADDPSVRRFVHPPVDRDGSGAWTAEVLTAWDEARRRSDHRVRLLPCTDIRKAVCATLWRDSVVIAAIRRGLLHASTRPEAPTWANDLLATDEAAWLKRLDRRIHRGQKPAAQRLLEARLQDAVQRGVYPTGLGADLRGALQTVPIGRIHSRLNGKLISTRLMQDITNLAQPGDAEDLERLADATGHGTGHRSTASAGQAEYKTADGPGSLSTPEENLEWLVEQRSERSTAQRIDRLLDEARLSFVVEHDGPWEAPAFIDLIASFYAHTFRHAGITLPANTAHLQGLAMSLVNQAFAREGGYKAAIANAQDHVHGGMRRVLDLMTDTLKAQLRAADTYNANALALDGRDYDKALAQAKHLARQLPQPHKEVAPELLVNQLEPLIDATVESDNRFDRILRKH